MKYVIDSSVMVKWVLTERDTDKAKKLREDYRNAIHELISPDICTAEIAHALTRAERQTRIAVGQARTHLLDILTSPPQLSHFEPLMLRAIDISSLMRCGIYDCLYVALGEQENCEVVTADTTMVKVLQGRFPFIRALSSMT